jgi:polyhydroxyalkanoate synthesis regulator phasin
MPVADTKQRNIVERLADIGEEAIQRIGSAPGGDRLLAAMANMRDRVDDLQKRVRGLEGLDTRVAELERRIEKLEGKPHASAGKSSSSSSSTPKRPAPKSPS